jgi:hypothetical protein
MNMMTINNGIMYRKWSMFAFENSISLAIAPTHPHAALAKDKIGQ